MSDTIGVGHCLVAAVRLSICPWWLPALSESSARGVGQFRTAASVRLVPACAFVSGLPCVAVGQSFAAVESEGLPAVA